MKTESFQANLRSVDEYRSSPETRHYPLDRLFSWSDTWFYIRFVLIIAEGNRLAQRGEFTRKDWSGRAWRILNVAEACGAKIMISGLEHPKNVKGPVIYVANHMSMFETMILPGAIILAFHDVTTVVKRSLTKYPLFGIIMRYLHPIVVDRKNPREDLKTVLAGGVEAVKKGQSVLLFPQSTRTHYFAPAEFNSLGAKLAKRANVPLIPVALRTDFQGVGRLVRDFGPLDRKKPVHFKFGPPIEPIPDTRTMQQQALNFITTNLQEWGVEVRQ